MATDIGHITYMRPGECVVLKIAKTACNEAACFTFAIFFLLLMWCVRMSAFHTRFVLVMGPPSAKYMY